MAEIDNIPEMRPSFDNIRRQDEGGNEYWSSRDLCAAMGYSAYWKFQRVIDKAIKVAGEKGMNVDDHFNQAVDMVGLEAAHSVRSISSVFRVWRVGLLPKMPMPKKCWYNKLAIILLEQFRQTN